MPDPVTVKLPNLDGRDATLTLVPPASLAQRWAVIGLGQEVPTTAAGAALGLCWSRPAKGAPPVRWLSLPGAYGEAVMDNLLGRGVSFRDFFAAGAVAYKLIAESIEGISDEEVSAVEDFTGAPKGA